MKFFVDTANIEEIRELAELGIIDGVTTNPSLVAKEKGSYDDLLREICALVDGPISAEVTALDVEGMLTEGDHYASLHDNIVVKLPTTPDGLKACRRLVADDIRVNMTLIFSPLQALLCARAGATFVSPFIGRLDDISQEGMGVIEQTVQIFDNYNFPTEVLVASVRHPVHILQAAMIGADVCTVPHKILMQMIRHPLTDSGLEKFLADWKKSGR
ncbi:MAG: fructose-6-phosphate aldolase [Candidatus Eisenbacteria bacterium]|nr:fructose-6-phosphate aldolase [Candidatus Eisenbacteria bacterium]